MSYGQEDEGVIGSKARARHCLSIFSKVQQSLSIWSYHVDTDEKKMDHFHNGLDADLYKRLNLVKVDNYHELVNLAISQEDAMKKA